MDPEQTQHGIYATDANEQYATLHTPAYGPEPYVQLSVPTDDHARSNETYSAVYESEYDAKPSIGPKYGPKSTEYGTKCDPESSPNPKLT